MIPPLAGFLSTLVWIILWAGYFNRQRLLLLLEAIAPRPPRGWVDSTPRLEREAGLVFEQLGDRHVLWPGYWKWRASNSNPSIWWVKPEGDEDYLWLDPRLGYLEALEKSREKEQEKERYKNVKVIEIAHAEALKEVESSALNEFAIRVNNKINGTVSIPAAPIPASSHRITFLETKILNHRALRDVATSRVNVIEAQLYDYLARTSKPDLSLVEDAYCRINTWKENCEADKREALAAEKELAQLQGPQVFIPATALYVRPCEHHYTDSNFCDICGHFRTK